MSSIPFSTLFEETPSVDSIKAAIISGGTLTLAKLNQHFLLGKVQMPCADQARYLDRVNGLLETKIWDNNNQINSLAVSIRLAKNDIFFARKAVELLNVQIESLRVD